MEKIKAYGKDGKGENHPETEKFENKSNTHEYENKPAALKKGGCA